LPKDNFSWLALLDDLGGGFVEMFVEVNMIRGVVDGECVA
jgi:hypothetical protein